MSLYNGPPRPGARGGRDQFNWESVKSDKDREFYLGHSVKATVGRWQKGKDVFWYTREKEENGTDPRESELALVKQREEELMMEALGMKPKSVRPMAKPQLSQMEMKQLFDGHPADQEAEEDEAGKERDEADRIKGVGFRSGQIFGSGDAEREVMAGVGMNRKQPGNTQKDPGPGPRSGEGNALPPPPKISGPELKKLRKAQEKDAKKEKKAKRKAKKEAKQAKKEHKAARRKEREEGRGIPSDSSSSASDDEDQPRKRLRHDSPDDLPRERSRHRDSPPKRRERHAVEDRRRHRHSPLPSPPRRDREQSRRRHAAHSDPRDAHWSRSPSRHHDRHR